MADAGRRLEAPAEAPAAETALTPTASTAAEATEATAEDERSLVAAESDPLDRRDDDRPLARQPVGGLLVKRLGECGDVLPAFRAELFAAGVSLVLGDDAVGLFDDDDHRLRVAAAGSPRSDAIAASSVGRIGRPYWSGRLCGSRRTGRSRTLIA